jgi:hypothetical protein
MPYDLYHSGINHSGIGCIRFLQRSIGYDHEESIIDSAERHNR